MHALHSMLCSTVMAFGSLCAFLWCLVCGVFNGENFFFTSTMLLNAEERASDLESERFLISGSR